MTWLSLVDATGVSNDKDSPVEMFDARVVFESCGFAAPVALNVIKSPGATGKDFPAYLRAC